MPPMFQADSEQLTELAQTFNNQADVMRQILETLKARMADLQGGGWYGQGADQFYQYMEQHVFPEIHKFINYLEHSAQTAQGTANRIDEGAQRILAIARRFSGRF